MTTQNCAECSTPAEPGQPFCESCGAVLSWTYQAGARSAAHGEPDRARPGAPGAGISGGGAGRDGTPTASPRRETRPRPDVAGVVPRAGSAPGADAARARDAAARDRGAAPTHASAPHANADDSTIPIRAITPGDAMTDRARRLLVPVADPPAPAAPPSVAPTLPGRPTAPRPQVQDLGKDPGVDGGVPCPW